MALRQRVTPQRDILLPGRHQRAASPRIDPTECGQEARAPIRIWSCLLDGEETYSFDKWRPRTGPVDAYEIEIWELISIRRAGEGAQMVLASVH